MAPGALILRPQALAREQMAAPTVANPSPLRPAGAETQGAFDAVHLPALVILEHAQDRPADALSRAAGLSVRHLLVEHLVVHAPEVLQGKRVVTLGLVDELGDGFRLALGHLLRVALVHGEAAAGSRL